MIVPKFRASKGFSIIELMVAMAIGLIGSLIMMQIFAESEGGRRAIGALSDSQSNGVVGMFAVERDLQQAGLGMLDLKVLGCRVRSSGAFNNKMLLSPVAIIPDGAAASSSANHWQIPLGDAGSDMIAIAYGSTAIMVEGSPVVAAPTGNVFPVENTYGLKLGDRIVVADGSKDCTMALINGADTLAGNITLDFNAGISYDASASAFSLGGNARIVVYAVRNGRLTACDFLVSDCSDAGSLGDSTVWAPVANDVVALSAQYGWDTSATPDMVADAYCKSRLAPGNACPASDTGSPAAGNGSLSQAQRACDWARIPVIRLAVVTRSGQYEKEEVSPASIKLWPDSATAPTTTGPIYTPPGADGRHFRYRVLHSQVALRNLIWSGAKSSC
jgi:type IV pilus assembly protein PilW